VKAIGTAKSGAIFSDCMKYRYRLWRCWDPSLPRALFILLNPSTADDIENDPTIERQQRRVMMWGTQNDLFSRPLASQKFGSIEVVNACAYRSTNPEALFEVEDPVGDDNGEHINDGICQTLAGSESVPGGGIIICGWGTHLNQLSCGMYLLHEVLLESIENYPLSALKLNSDGTPQHPLYLPYDLKPRRWLGGELHEEVV
jgi:hypothetical protein